MAPLKGDIMVYKYTLSVNYTGHCIVEVEAEDLDKAVELAWEEIITNLDGLDARITVEGKEEVEGGEILLLRETLEAYFTPDSVAKQLAEKPVTDIITMYKTLDGFYECYDNDALTLQKLTTKPNHTTTEWVYGQEGIRKVETCRDEVPYPTRVNSKGRVVNTIYMGDLQAKYLSEFLDLGFGVILK